MSNKVVWVFGCSAAGKSTFIKRMVTKDDVNLLTELGWINHHILAIQESIDYIKQSENDPIGDRRVEIIDRVIEENNRNNNTIMLIKGQNVDFDNNLVGRLIERLPNIDYEVIFLFSDLETIFERGKKKEWFTEEDDNIDDWYDHMYKTALLVKGLKNMKVIAIDSTDGFRISSFQEYDNNVRNF